MSLTPFWRGNLVAAASTLAWATAFPVTDILLHHWDPVPLAALRLMLAASAICLFAAFTGEIRTWRNAPFGQIAVLGGLGVGGTLALFIGGQSLSGALTAAIIGASLPVISAVIDIFQERRIQARLLLGIALGLGGGVLASWQPGHGGISLGMGELMLVCAQIGWAWYSRSAAGLSGLSALGQSGLTLLAGGLTLLLALLVLGPLELVGTRTSWTPNDMALAFWMGVIAIGLATPLWMWAIKLLGMTAASIHLNLAPFHVLLIGLALGGPFPAIQACGAILVVAGAIISQTSARRAAVQTTD